MFKSVAPPSLMLQKCNSGTRCGEVVSALSFTLKFRRSLTDLLSLRSFTKLCIEMFAGRLFIAFRISSGIEFLVRS